LVVRPVALAAPAEVFGTASPIDYSVTFGYTGAFTATARGLVPAATTTGTVADDPADDFNPEGEGVTAVSVTVPAGITHARFSLFDADVDPGADIDLYLADSTNELIAVSGTGGSDEEINIRDIAPGNYTVYVHGFAVDGNGSPFKLYTWLLDGPAGMVATAPASATTGATGTISVTFSGLTPPLPSGGSKRPALPRCHSAGSKGPPYADQR
jgi:hypothetical protein